MRNDNGIEDIYIGGESSKKNKNNKFIIFIIICSIVLIATVGAYFYMSNSSINVSKEAFDKAFSNNNIVKLSDVDFYKNVYKKVMTQNSGMDTVVNFQMGGSGQDNNKIDLTKVSFNFSTKSQASDSKTSTDLAVNYSNNEFFKMNILTTKKAFGISQDEIVNKYIVTNYDTAKQSMGLNINKKKINTWTRLEPFDLSEEEREEYIKNLYRKMMDNISEDKFKTSDNIVLNNDGGNSIPVKAYTLDLTQEEFKDYLISLLTIIRNDEDLIDKIVTNVSSDTISTSSNSSERMFSGESNIESIIVNDEENSNINVVINRVQSESNDDDDEDDEDNSTSRRSTENMFNVDGDNDNNNQNNNNNNQDENSNNRNNNNQDNNNNNNDNNDNRDNNANGNNGNSGNNGNNEQNSNNLNDGNSNGGEINAQNQEQNQNQTQNQENDSEATRVVPAGNLEPGYGNGFSNLSANVRNFETALSVEELTVDEINEIERSELSVTNNDSNNNRTVFTALLDDFGLDDLQITELLNSDVLENEEYVNALRLILGIKLDTTKAEFQEKIDKYIEKVKKFKGSGMTITVYVSDEKTEKISFVMPNSNKLDIEILKQSDDENNIKFTYLYSGTNSQLFDIQESVTYSADENIKVNSDDNSKLNGFSVQVDRFSKDINNNVKVSYQKIEQEEVQKKVIFNLKSSSDAGMNEIKNSVNVSISTKNKPEEQCSIANNITFAIVPDIEGFTDENCVHLDELSSDDYNKLMLVLQDRINQVRRDKEKSLNLIVSNTSRDAFNRNDFIANTISRDDARELIIKEVRELMKKAEDEEREFTLEDLRDLNVDGYNVSKNISEEKAVIVIDVYTFNISKDLQISDGD